VLTLQDTCQVPAALAVLSALIQCQAAA
jgi:hypothetical protein